MRFFNITLSIFLSLQILQANAQVNNRISAAYQTFSSDPQMKYGISSLLVVDARTGNTIFSRNENIGLAPASTLKVVTAATAFEILGPGFTFKTPFSFSGGIENGVLQGDIIIGGSGDPTSGSWRYASTKNFAQLTQLGNAFAKAGIKDWKGKFIVNNGSFGTQATPGGWTFDDMGNYYGAGPAGFNWYENQYDLVLNPGQAEGQPVKIAGTKPIADAVEMVNELKTGPKGSGDGAIIYPDRWPGGSVRGTVPAGVSSFTISGSVSDPANYFQKSLNQFGANNGYPLLQTARVEITSNNSKLQPLKALTTFESPGLDSIVYFFLQKSINLYGEALVKQLALKAGKEATTEEGVKWVRTFWQDKGIDKAALKMVDGSGLSPHNRVTTRTLVQVMQHARKQNWYPVFYEGLQLINAIKMKSGSISGVRAYTGYIKSSIGEEYTFAFIVNNFDGTSSAIMQKMFTVLNALK
jgi:D-alanyl-D-alanine carboxypeptidase/D-alanyl-D-alanine-endopeptidase (penicillin-binding protein 4)